MIFLISLAVSILLVLLCGKALRASPVPFYIGAALISASAAVITWSGAVLPHGFAEYIWPIFSRGGLAGALFIIVMFTGAFPNGSAPIKRLMPIRGPLSIIASILTLGHNAAYGRVYFLRLFTAPMSLPVNQLLAAVCSVVMLAVMLPLFVTSFQRVRRKMAPKAWKRLQRWAYLFYSLLCCHIMLLTMPGAMGGEPAYRLTVFVYGAVFLSYLVCRTGKALAKRIGRPVPLAGGQAGAAICCAVLSGIFTFALGVGTPAQAKTAANPTPAPAETAGPAASTPCPDGAAGAQETAAAVSGKYRDGAYTGSAMGMNAPIEVSVTIEGGRIIDVVIESQREDEPYFSDALCVIDGILEENSTQVDTITGATYSSGGILDAVDNALEQALGG